MKDEGQVTMGDGRSLLPEGSMIVHRPWVGADYDKGIDGQRIAIMGYSAWTPDDHADYTIESVRNVVSGAWKNVQFFNAVARYFDMAVPPFYERVVFFEFVPCSVGGGDSRYAVATPEQAEAGRERLLSIISEHSVQKLLVFSAKGWASVPPLVEAAVGPLPRLQQTDFPWGSYNAGNLTTTAVGLRHPQYAPGKRMRLAVIEALALLV